MVINIDIPRFKTKRIFYVPYYILNVEEWGNVFDIISLFAAEIKTSAF
jgi:hypothetical protein